MVVSGVVSIPSSVGSSTVFTVTGTRTLMYAQAFQAYLDQALGNKTLNIDIGTSASGTVTFDAPKEGYLNEAVAAGPSDQASVIGATIDMAQGYQFLFDNVNGATTINGATNGGDVLVEGTGAAATYFDNGGNNAVVFVNGNNTYVGDSTASAGNDTVVAGSGFDTITTGVGPTTVDSGTGRALINLDDTTPGPQFTFNASVYLDDGNSTVNANGYRDLIVVTTPGQTINGGSAANAFDEIVLLPGADSMGNNIINANNALVDVFASSSGNSILGGSGVLNFIAEPGITDTIEAGSGKTYLWGAAGSVLTFSSGSDGGISAFIAGGGNETLLGGSAQSGIAIYANNSSDSVTTSGVNEYLQGGAGNDTLFSGAGTETLSGGGGSNIFIIDATNDGIGGHITITDFSPTDLVAFSGYSVSQVDTALADAQTVTGANGETNTVVTLSDHTTVTFLDVSSLNGHTFIG